MRTHSIWSWLAAAVWGVSCGILSAEPVQRHLTMKVTAESSSDYQKIPNSSERIKHQSRQLNFALDNRDKEEVKDVSVKWAIYARKMRDNKVILMKEGTEKSKIAALGAVTLKSARVMMKGNPKYSVVTSKNNNNRDLPQFETKKYPADGEEYYGYSVQMYVGTELIDEVYSQPSLKAKK